MCRLLFLLIIAAMSTSCAKTFVEKAKSWDPKEEVPALMVHYSVVDQYSLTKGKSMVEAVTDIANKVSGGSSSLEIAGEKSLGRLKPLFAHYNMKLYFDSEAAAKATKIEGVIKQTRTNEEGGKKGFLADGSWLHPDTVEEPFHMQGTLFQDKYYKAIASSTLEKNKKNVVVSMGMDFNMMPSWLFGWVCEASFRSRVLNAEGKPVLLVSSVGKSSTHWFGGKDRYLVKACPEAAEGALSALAKVEPGTL